MKKYLNILVLLLVSNFSLAGEMPDHVKELYKLLPTKIEAKKLADEFVLTLKEKNYDESYRLLNPQASTFSKEKFIKANKGAEERFGPWTQYMYVNPMVQTVRNPQTGEESYIPAYLYEINLKNYNTKLLLIVMMDIQSEKPRIVAYNYMPKNTIEYKDAHEME
ncbi:MAG: hypothetical protein JKY26_01710 [Pseudomonas sp.]|uniref:hypothetical protein n=1 Tax=Halopseudomonas sp. TaxID=2901191 RepID=UPI001A6282CE|nr:hypothetical protein [Pseudomonas sp.]|tara:strand:+ start:919 stop:1410 length:492 start_codon:yes stop_codon:yes gene_type:complete